MHHRNGGPAIHWEETKRKDFEVPFQHQTFELQLQLERHDSTGDHRVFMFCRRVHPPGSTLTGNTQRGTFNSTHRGPEGFFQRPYLLKKNPEQRRALAKLLPCSGSFPRWDGRRVQLGDGDAQVLLERFLKATSVVEEIKGTSASQLARRFPLGPVFSGEDIAAAAFSEGKRKQVSQAVRERSAKLRQLAIEHHKQHSRDGRLRCFVDDWAPKIPVSGSIVEIHHDDTLAGYPPAGKKVSFVDAIKYMFPMCPNCHRLLHAKPGGGRYTIPELRTLMQRRKKAK